MRRAKIQTPTPKMVSNKCGAKGESSSGKKLVQPRLPFKIIAASPSTAAEPTEIQGVVKERQDARKRKLSYEEEEGNEVEQAEQSSASKENLSVVAKKKKTIDEELDTDIILLDDEDIDHDEEDEGDETVAASPQTPQLHLEKRKGAGTPISAGNIKIKLPMSGKKNKRKKSLQKSTKTENVSSDGDALTETRTESSDEIEMLANKLNPQKRKKLEEPASTQIKIVAVIDLDSESELEASASDCNSDLSPEMVVEVAMVADIEADDEGEDCAEIADNSSRGGSSEIEEKPTELVHNTADQNKERTGENHTTSPKTRKSSIGAAADQKRNLTPKQKKVNEQRLKAREEKERKLQEEKMQKQLEKNKKDEQKRKEREEKENKRLAEIEAKNEEKRKRNEAKEEELRKKDEDRRRKEQEKEDSEMKKKKAAAAFSRFFVPKATPAASAVARQDPIENEGSQVSKKEVILAFRPFQIKGDMKLAPLCRRIFSAEARLKMDSISQTLHDDSTDEVIVRKKPMSKSQLYLSELKTGKISPGKWIRRNSTEKKVYTSDNDVMIIEDELERAGQAIVEETHRPMERLRAKFYKFHENRRPPYFGTWRKKTNLITPRRFLGQDTKYFDYDVDSDLEWEEEEPGESLNGSDDEKESEDEDYEVDNKKFVPHGHLSDGELQNEDESGADNNNTREAQKAKLKILQQEFAQEMKKKTEKIKPRLLGCIWVDENGNQPELCPNIIWETLTTRAMLFTEPPIVEEPALPERAEPSSPSGPDKLKPIVLSEKMLQDLIRLVHGNRHAKVFLIKEFIAYVEANEESIKNGDARCPLKSAVRERIEEFAEWQVMETGNQSKRKKTKKRLCWVVADSVLERMNLKDLSLSNQWQYVLTPKFVEMEKATEGDPVAAGEDTDASTERDVPSSSSQATTSRGSTQSSDITKEKQDEQPNVKRSKALSGKQDSKPTVNVVPAVKKRVPLLMSVAPGQQISTPAKNALISQFLHKSSELRNKAKADVPVKPAPMEDVVVVLE